MKPTLVVLAAGMGSRYGGMKQIDPVGRHGEAIIDYSVYDAIRAGFGRVVFVIRREIESDVRAFFAGKFDSRIAVDYVFQEVDDLPEPFIAPPRAKPWGTAHAVLAARRVVDTPFAVINGDDYYGRSAFAAIGSYLRDTPTVDRDYVMVAYELARTLSEHGTVSRGIVDHSADGWLSGIEEHTRIRREGDQIVSRTADGAVRAVLAPGQPTSMNLFGFGPSAMGLLWQTFRDFLQDNLNDPGAEFYIPKATNVLRAAGKVRMRVLTTPSDWFGVTYQADRPEVMARVAALIEAGEYPDPLWG